MASDKLVITGGRKLKGEVWVSGAKNAALPVMAAALLTPEECVFYNVPDIEDTRVMAEILTRLGCEVDFDGQAHRVRISARALHSQTVPPELASRMRASFLVVGPLLARTGRAVAPPPGGCAIGSRPVNVDIKGFAAMGATVRLEAEGYVIEAPGGRLHGQRTYLDYPSHTGTENLLMSAALARGKTVVKNASHEPEVVGLANLLEQMGARISGAGSSMLEIDGVERLRGVHYRVIPDRIEAGTFAIAAAITGGEVVLRDIIPAHMDPLTYKLLEAGVEVEESGGMWRVRARFPMRALEVQTLPYPGFPTDLQAELATLLTQAEGTSVVHERVYDNRLRYAAELRRLGANIEVSGQTAIIKGPTRLHGAPVTALDLRAGAALTLAGLAAEGTTEISDVYHIDRGYERFDDKLRSLGADIWREKEEEAALAGFKLKLS